MWQHPSCPLPSSSLFLHKSTQGLPGRIALQRTCPAASHRHMHSTSHRACPAASHRHMHSTSHRACPAASHRHRNSTSYRACPAASHRHMHSTSHRACPAASRKLHLTLQPWRVAKRATLLSRYCLCLSLLPALLSPTLSAALPHSGTRSEMMCSTLCHARAACSHWAPGTEEVQERKTTKPT